MLPQNKNLYLWMIGLGLVLFFASIVAGSGVGPDLFTNLGKLIAALFGILFGAGISVGLGQAKQRKDRLVTAWFALVLGLLYIVISTVSQVRIPIEQWVGDQLGPWLDIYPAAGGAIAGAGLSLILADLRRQSGKRKLREISDQSIVGDYNQPARLCRRSATSKGGSPLGVLLLLASCFSMILLRCIHKPPAQPARSGRNRRFRT